MKGPILLAALLVSACATTPVAPPATTAATSVAGASTAMVSAADYRAAEAGIAMLRAGGSAFDASAATLLALTVVEPQSSGIGGGGLLVYQPASGGVLTIRR